MIGVSSGAFGAAATEERPQLLGLYRKAQYSVTQGVQFVQIDLESVSEFEEPDLEQMMKESITKKLNIIFGIHSETKAFGVEAAELDSALETEYTRAHARLIDVLKKSGKIGSKYVLIHSSESDPFPILALRAQPAELVDFFGRPLDKLLKEDNESLIDWVMDGAGKFLWVEILGRNIDQYLEEYKSEVKREFKLARERVIPSDQLEEESEKYAEGERLHRKEQLRKQIVDIVFSRSLHYGPERWAYYFVAKWMEKNNNQFWKKMIDTNLDFFVERERKSSPTANITRETLLHEKNVKDPYSMDDKGLREFHELWVSAVSAKYLWGHLNPEKCDDTEWKGRFEDPKPTIKTYDMPLTLESPMGGRGIEEWLRFYNPLQMYCLAEEVNSKTGYNYLQLALDLEHMLSIRLDPELVIRLFPEGAGKLVKVIHAGWPSTLAPAHVPIALGSDQQLYLYRMYYKLRQKGFGIDPKEKCFILFERGPFPIQQTVIALKEIAKFLEQGTPPEQLPLEFYGLDIGTIERQRVAISEHATDPLGGVITVSELEHTFLGKAALEKGKRPEEWKKEELR